MKSTINLECSLSPLRKMADTDHCASVNGKHVNFEENNDVEKKREKYLTAKYGAHQMSLIRKRLGVEMWMYEKLQDLYGCIDDSQTPNAEIDLDELLDMDSDTHRKKFLESLLTGVKSSNDAVKEFIEELLQRAKTL